MFDKYPRGSAYIDLAAVINNVKKIKQHVGKDKKLTAVIKADAYGHGAKLIVKHLEEMDEIYGYATATAEEAFELRESGAVKPILVLNYAFPNLYEEIIKNDIRITVFREDELIALNAAAVNLNKNAYVHIKLDTGMSRIGVLPNDEGISFAQKCLSLSNIKVEGIFSHFARADETDKKYALKQLEQFKAFNERLKDELGLVIPIKHIANSAAICELNDSYFDMVRAGIILYGLAPSNEVDIKPLGLKPVLSLYSHVIYVKTRNDGVQVSYGGHFTCHDNTVIATIPLGYADGYPRSLSSKGYVLIHGRKAPIIGNICMDQFMVDVTDIPDVKEGDLVTLVGSDNGAEILLDEISELSGRFNYEFACCLGNRIQRVYEKD